MWQNTYIIYMICKYIYCINIYCKMYICLLRQNKHTKGLLLFLLLLFIVRCFKGKLTKIQSYSLWTRLRGYEITDPGRYLNRHLLEMSIPVSTASMWFVRITIALDSLKNLEVIMDTEPGSKLYIYLLHISQLFRKCFQMGCLYFKAVSIKVKSLPVADFNSCL